MKRKWKVWEPINMEESDAIEVEHFTAEWAAEEGAEKIDDGSAHETYDLSGPTEPNVELHVRADDGTLHIFDTSCYLERYYTANEKE